MLACIVKWVHKEVVFLEEVTFETSNQLVAAVVDKLSLAIHLIVAERTLVFMSLSPREDSLTILDVSDELAAVG